MQNSILSAAYFHNKEAAYEFVEARLWPQGPVFPKCGVIGNSAKLRGKSTRVRVYKCRDCRKPFRVTVGAKGEKRGRGYHHKNKVLSLVDRNSGRARSFVVDDVKAATLVPIVRANLAREARLMTDDHGGYKHVGLEFAAHSWSSIRSGSM